MLLLAARTVDGEPVAKTSLRSRSSAITLGESRHDDLDGGGQGDHHSRTGYWTSH
jgi:hypothetical protein